MSRTIPASLMPAKLLRVVPFSMRRMRSEILASEKPGGFGMGKLRILERVSEGDGEVSVMSRQLEMSTALVSRSLDDLVKKGLVVRERESSDRRRIAHRLTPSGRAAFRKSIREATSLLEERLERLSEPEVAALDQGLMILERLFSG